MQSRVFTEYHFNYNIQKVKSLQATLLDVEMANY